MHPQPRQPSIFWLTMTSSTMLWYGYLACTPLNTTSIWWHHGWHRSAVLQSHPYIYHSYFCLCSEFVSIRKWNKFLGRYGNFPPQLLRGEWRPTPAGLAGCCCFRHLFNFECINLLLRLYHPDALLLLCCSKRLCLVWLKYAAMKTNSKVLRKM